MKKILMLSSLSLWNFTKKGLSAKTAGNQTFYNTLKGYSENGVRVIVLTFNDIPENPEVFPGVTMKKSYIFSLINFFIKILRFVKHQIKKVKKSEQELEITKDIKKTGSKRLHYICSVLGVIEGLFISIFFKPDVYYGYEVYCTIPASILSKLFKKPIVTRFQGTELGFLLEDEKKFQEAKYLIKGTKVNSDLAIMANDGTDGDKVLKKLGIDQSVIRFWSNGLHNKEYILNMEEDKDYRIKMGLSDNTFIICTANRFVDWKRIDRIINVIHELNNNNVDVCLIAIGDGSEKKALEQLVEVKRINNVIFTGALEHKETIYHISNCDLYITLNHSGNLGNSIYEALALGKVIATIRNDSVERVLKSGYNSILFDTTDLKEIAYQISNLILDCETQKILKQNAKEYAEKCLLSWEDRMKLEVTEVNKLN
ncbi:MAG: glycosyltransferase family 4 protein [Firmicutes bacterium]|nr:glycosyltransferase family 4 protein [Bacillota bacterium]